MKIFLYIFLFLTVTTAGFLTAGTNEPFLHYDHTNQVAFYGWGAGTQYVVGAFSPTNPAVSSNAVEGTYYPRNNPSNFLSAGTLTASDTWVDAGGVTHLVWYASGLVTNVFTNGVSIIP
jgi:hypothetical protein